MKRFMVVLAVLLASSISAFGQMDTGQGGNMMGGSWGSGWGMGYGGFGVIVAIAVILVVVLIMKRK